MTPAKTTSRTACVGPVAITTTIAVWKATPTSFAHSHRHNP